MRFHHGQDDRAAFSAQNLLRDIDIGQQIALGLIEAFNLAGGLLQAHEIGGLVHARGQQGRQHRCRKNAAALNAKFSGDDAHRRGRYARRAVLRQAQCGGAGLRQDGQQSLWVLQCSRIRSGLRMGERAHNSRTQCERPWNSCCGCPKH